MRSCGLNVETRFSNRPKVIPALAGPDNWHGQPLERANFAAQMAVVIPHGAFEFGLPQKCLKGPQGTRRRHSATPEKIGTLLGELAVTWVTHVRNEGY